VMSKNIYDPLAHSLMSQASISPMASPTPTTTFVAATSSDLVYPTEYNGIPPDTGGAVSASYVVTALNGVVLVQDRNGNRLSIKSLDSFWGIIPASQFSFDPTVEYDTFNNRWIMTSASAGNDATGRIYIAVSATGDPTGTWYRWETYPSASFPHIYTSTGSCDLADYPHLGFNKNWVVLSTNMLQHRKNASGVYVDTNSGAFVSIFNKASLYANLDPSSGATKAYTLYALDNSYGLTQTPSVSNDNSVNALYLVQDWNGNSGQLRLYKVDGSVTSPSLSTVNYPSGSGWTDFNAGPLTAPQADSPNGVDIGASAIDNAVYRNGSVWCTHTVIVNNSAVVQWWQLSTSGGVQQQGRIGGNDIVFRAYPSIAVNSSNAVCVGYAYFFPYAYPSGAYSYRAGSDPSGTMQAERVYASGLAPYYAPDNNRRNRWGDWSRTVVDPVDDLGFWTIQEYSGNNNTWGTEWAHF